MDLMNEIRARRERLGLAVARNPVVAPEMAAKLVAARNRPKKTATVDGRKPKQRVDVPEPVFDAGLKALVMEAKDRLAGFEAGKETKLEMLVVLEDHNTTWMEVIGESRKAALARARKEVYRLLHRRGFSYERIGQMMGRDRTTVMWGVRGDGESAALGEGKE